MWLAFPVSHSKVQLLHRLWEIMCSRATPAFINSVLTVLTQPSVLTVLIVLSALRELKTLTN